MRRPLLAIAAAVVLVGGASAAVAASSDATRATCTPSPVVTGKTVAAIDVHCSVPRVGATATVTKTVTKTVTAPPPPTTTSSSPTSSPTSTTTPAGVCTPAQAKVTFTGQGSAGLGQYGEGDYDASAEMWGVNGYDYTQEMGVCSHRSWYVDVTTDNTKGDGAVKAYPSMRRIYHDWGAADFSGDPHLSSFPELTIDFAATGPSPCPDCIYDTAFDLWLNGIANSTSVEVMVWTENVKQVPYGTKVASGIQFGGHTWDLYAGGSNHYIAYVPTDTSSIPSGTLDVKALIADLVTRGRIAADPTVGQVSFGVETVSTGAVSRHWDFTDFTVHDGS